MNAPRRTRRTEMNVAISLESARAEKIMNQINSSKDLARHDKARNLRSWWPKDLKMNFHDAELNFTHRIKVQAYLDEYTK